MLSRKTFAVAYIVASCYCYTYVISVQSNDNFEETICVWVINVEFAQLGPD
jgi:hypothetical protein